jgi:tRNA(Ile)-lysidine synthase
LLDVSRADLEAYAHAHALAWVDDESNLDTRFTRNFLRHSIFKPLAERFPAAERNLAAASSRFAEATMLLDDLARVDLGANAADFPLPLAVLAGLSEPRARNVLRHLLARRGVRIPSEARLVEGLRQLLAAAPDRHPSVTLGEWQLCRRRGDIELEPAQTT